MDKKFEAAAPLILKFVDKLAQEVAPMPEGERGRAVVKRIVGDVAQELSMLLQQAGADSAAHFIHGYTATLRMILVKAHYLAQEQEAADSATRH